MTLQLPVQQEIPAELLNVALTHSSYAREHPGTPDNERLEFLGDAVIGLAWSEHLYQTHPEEPEGELALRRANAVSAAALATRARSLELGKHLRLGRGAEKSGGRDNNSVLADTFEAVVGAIFVGCGWEAARDFVLTQLSQVPLEITKDHKSRLQEWLQAVTQQTPVYIVEETSGPDHDKRFNVAVSHQNQILGQGRGRSKKEAEQQAARQALVRLGVAPTSVRRRTRRHKKRNTPSLPPEPGI